MNEFGLASSQKVGRCGWARLGLLLAVVGAMLLTACANDGERDELDPSTTTSSTSDPDGPDVESDNFGENFRETQSTLRELVRSADRIVLGEVVARAQGYVIGEPGHELAYDEVQIRVKEVISGAGVSEGQTLAFYELRRERGSDDDDVVSPVVATRGVFLLKEMPAPPTRRPPAPGPTQWFFAGVQAGFFELPNDEVRPRASDGMSRLQAEKGWTRLVEDIRREARNADR